MRWKKAMLPRSPRKFWPGSDYEPGVLAPRSSKRQDVSLECEERGRTEPLHLGLAPFSALLAGRRGSPRAGAPRAAAQSSTACQAKRQCSLRSVNLPCNCQPTCCSGLGCPARALPAQPAVAPLQATPLPSLTSFTKLAMHGIERVATALSHIYTALLTVGHSLQLPVRHGARSNAPWRFLWMRR